MSFTREKDEARQLFNKFVQNVVEIQQNCKRTYDIVLSKEQIFENHLYISLDVLIEAEELDHIIPLLANIQATRAYQQYIYSSLNKHNRLGFKQAFVQEVMEAFTKQYSSTQKQNLSKFIRIVFESNDSQIKDCLRVELIAHIENIIQTNQKDNETDPFVYELLQIINQLADNEAYNFDFTNPNQSPFITIRDNLNNKGITCNSNDFFQSDFNSKQTQEYGNNEVQNQFGENPFDVDWLGNNQKVNKDNQVIQNNNQKDLLDMDFEEDQKEIVQNNNDNDGLTWNFQQFGDMNTIGNPEIQKKEQKEGGQQNLLDLDWFNNKELIDSQVSQNQSNISSSKKKTEGKKDFNLSDFMQNDVNKSITQNSSSKNQDFSLKDLGFPLQQIMRSEKDLQANLGSNEQIQGIQNKEISEQNPKEYQSEQQITSNSNELKNSDKLIANHSNLHNTNNHTKHFSQFKLEEDKKIHNNASKQVEENSEEIYKSSSSLGKGDFLLKFGMNESQLRRNVVQQNANIKDEEIDQNLLNPKNVPESFLIHGYKQAQADMRLNNVLGSIQKCESVNSKSGSHYNEQPMEQSLENFNFDNFLRLDYNQSRNVLSDDAVAPQPGTVARGSQQLNSNRSGFYAMDNQSQLRQQQQQMENLSGKVILSQKFKSNVQEVQEGAAGKQDLAEKGNLDIWNDMESYKSEEASRQSLEDSYIAQVVAANQGKMPPMQHTPSSQKSNLNLSQASVKSQVSKKSDLSKSQKNSQIIERSMDIIQKTNQMLQKSKNQLDPAAKENIKQVQSNNSLTQNQNQQEMKSNNDQKDSHNVCLDQSNTSNNNMQKFNFDDFGLNQSQLSASSKSSQYMSRHDEDNYGNPMQLNNIGMHDNMILQNKHKTSNSNNLKNLQDNAVLSSASNKKISESLSQKSEQLCKKTQEIIERSKSFKTNQNASNENNDENIRQKQISGAQKSLYKEDQSAKIRDLIERSQKSINKTKDEFLKQDSSNQYKFNNNSKSHSQLSNHAKMVSSQLSSNQQKLPNQNINFEDFGNLNESQSQNESLSLSAILKEQYQREAKVLESPLQRNQNEKSNTLDNNSVIPSKQVSSGLQKSNLNNFDFDEFGSVYESESNQSKSSIINVIHASAIKNKYGIQSDSQSDYSKPISVGIQQSDDKRVSQQLNFSDFQSFEQSQSSNITQFQEHIQLQQSLSQHSQINNNNNNNSNNNKPSFPYSLSQIFQQKPDQQQQQQQQLQTSSLSLSSQTQQHNQQQQQQQFLEHSSQQSQSESDEKDMNFLSNLSQFTKSSDAVVEETYKSSERRGSGGLSDLAQSVSSIKSKGKMQQYLQHKISEDYQNEDKSQLDTLQELPMKEDIEFSNNQFYAQQQQKQHFHDYFGNQQDDQDPDLMFQEYPYKSYQSNEEGFSQKEIEKRQSQLNNPNAIPIEKYSSLSNFDKKQQQIIAESVSSSSQRQLGQAFNNNQITRNNDIFSPQNNLYSSNFNQQEESNFVKNEGNQQTGDVRQITQFQKEFLVEKNSSKEQTHSKHENVNKIIDFIVDQRTIGNQFQISSDVEQLEVKQQQHRYSQQNISEGNLHDEQQNIKDFEQVQTHQQYQSTSGYHTGDQVGQERTNPQFSTQRQANSNKFTTTKIENMIDHDQNNLKEVESQKINQLQQEENQQINNQEKSLNLFAMDQAQEQGNKINQEQSIEGGEPSGYKLMNSLFQNSNLCSEDSYQDYQMNVKSNNKLQKQKQDKKPVNVQRQHHHHHHHEVSDEHKDSQNSENNDQNQQNDNQKNQPLSTEDYYEEEQQQQENQLTQEIQSTNQYPDKEVNSNNFEDFNSQKEEYLKQNQISQYSSKDDKQIQTNSEEKVEDRQNNDHKNNNNNGEDEFENQKHIYDSNNNNYNTFFEIQKHQERFVFDQSQYYQEGKRTDMYSEGEIMNLQDQQSQQDSQQENQYTEEFELRKKKYGNNSNGGSVVTLEEEEQNYGQKILFSDQIQPTLLETVVENKVPEIDLLPQSRRDSLTSHMYKPKAQNLRPEDILNFDDEEQEQAAVAAKEELLIKMQLQKDQVEQFNNENIDFNQGYENKDNNPIDQEQRFENYQGEQLYPQNNMKEFQQNQIYNLEGYEEQKQENLEDNIVNEDDGNGELGEHENQQISGQQSDQMMKSGGRDEEEINFQESIINPAGEDAYKSTNKQILDLFPSIQHNLSRVLHSQQNSASEITIKNPIVLSSDQQLSMIDEHSTQKDHHAQLNNIEVIESLQSELSSPDVKKNYQFEEGIEIEQKEELPYPQNNDQQLAQGWNFEQQQIADTSNIQQQQQPLHNNIININHHQSEYEDFGVNNQFGFLEQGVVETGNVASNTRDNLNSNKPTNSQINTNFQKGHLDFYEGNYYQQSTLQKQSSNKNENNKKSTDNEIQLNDHQQQGTIEEDIFGNLNRNKSEQDINQEYDDNLNQNQNQEENNKAENNWFNMNQSELQDKNQNNSNNIFEFKEEVQRAQEINFDSPEQNNRHLKNKDEFGLDLQNTNEKNSEILQQSVDQGQLNWDDFENKTSSSKGSQIQKSFEMMQQFVNQQIQDSDQKQSHSQTQDKQKQQKSNLDDLFGFMGNNTSQKTKQDNSFDIMTKPNFNIFGENKNTQDVKQDESFDMNKPTMFNTNKNNEMEKDESFDIMTNPVMLGYDNQDEKKEESFDMMTKPVMFGGLQKNNTKKDESFDMNKPMKLHENFFNFKNDKEESFDMNKPTNLHSKKAEDLINMDRPIMMHKKSILHPAKSPVDVNKEFDFLKDLYAQPPPKLRINNVSMNSKQDLKMKTRDMDSGIDTPTKLKVTDAVQIQQVNPNDNDNIVDMEAPAIFMQNTKKSTQSGNSGGKNATTTLSNLNFAFGGGLQAAGSGITPIGEIDYDQQQQTDVGSLNSIAQIQLAPKKLYENSDPMQVAHQSNVSLNLDIGVALSEKIDSPNQIKRFDLQMEKDRSHCWINSLTSLENSKNSQFYNAKIKKNMSLNDIKISNLNSMARQSSLKNIPMNNNSSNILNILPIAAATSQKQKSSKEEDIHDIFSEESVKHLNHFNLTEYDNSQIAAVDDFDYNKKITEEEIENQTNNLNFKSDQSELSTPLPGAGQAMSAAIAAASNNILKQFKETPTPINEQISKEELTSSKKLQSRQEIISGNEQNAIQKAEQNTGSSCLKSIELQTQQLNEQQYPGNLVSKVEQVNYNIFSKTDKNEENQNIQNDQQQRINQRKSTNNLRNLERSPSQISQGNESFHTVQDKLDNSYQRNLGFSDEKKRDDSFYSIPEQQVQHSPEIIKRNSNKHIEEDDLQFQDFEMDLQQNLEQVKKAQKFEGEEAKQEDNNSQDTDEFDKELEKFNEQIIKEENKTKKYSDKNTNTFKPFALNNTGKMSVHLVSGDTSQIADKSSKSPSVSHANLSLKNIPKVMTYEKMNEQENADLSLKAILKENDLQIPSQGEQKVFEFSENQMKLKDNTEPFQNESKTEQIFDNINSNDSKQDINQLDQQIKQNKIKQQTSLTLQESVSNNITRNIISSKIINNEETSPYISPDFSGNFQGNLNTYLSTRLNPSAMIKSQKIDQDYVIKINFKQPNHHLKRMSEIQEQSQLEQIQSQGEQNTTSEDNCQINLSEINFEKNPFESDFEGHTEEENKTNNINITNDSKTGQMTNQIEQEQQDYFGDIEDKQEYQFIEVIPPSSQENRRTRQSKGNYKFDFENVQNPSTFTPSNASPLQKFMQQNYIEDSMHRNILESEFTINHSHISENVNTDQLKNNDFPDFNNLSPISDKKGSFKPVLFLDTNQLNVNPQNQNRSLPSNRIKKINSPPSSGNPAKQKSSYYTNQLMNQNSNHNSENPLSSNILQNKSQMSSNNDQKNEPVVQNVPSQEIMDDMWDKMRNENSISQSDSNGSLYSEITQKNLTVNLQNEQEKDKQEGYQENNSRIQQEQVQPSEIQKQDSFHSKHSKGAKNIQTETVDYQSDMVNFWINQNKQQQLNTLGSENQYSSRNNNNQIANDQKPNTNQIQGQLLTDSIKEKDIGFIDKTNQNLIFNHLTQPQQPTHPREKKSLDMNFIEKQSESQVFDSQPNQTFSKQLSNPQDFTFEHKIFSQHQNNRNSEKQNSGEVYQSVDFPAYYSVNEEDHEDKSVQVQSNNNAYPSQVKSSEIHLDQDQQFQLIIKGDMQDSIIDEIQMKQTTSQPSTNRNQMPDKTQLSEIATTRTITDSSKNKLSSYVPSNQKPSSLFEGKLTINSKQVQSIYQPTVNSNFGGAFNQDSQLVSNQQQSLNLKEYTPNKSEIDVSNQYAYQYPLHIEISQHPDDPKFFDVTEKEKDTKELDNKDSQTPSTSPKQVFKLATSYLNVPSPQTSHIFVRDLSESPNSFAIKNQFPEVTNRRTKSRASKDEGKPFQPIQEGILDIDSLPDFDETPNLGVQKQNPNQQIKSIREVEEHLERSPIKNLILEQPKNELGKLKLQKTEDFESKVEKVEEQTRIRNEDEQNKKLQDEFSNIYQEMKKLAEMQLKEAEITQQESFEQKQLSNQISSLNRQLQLLTQNHAVLVQKSEHGDNVKSVKSLQLPPSALPSNILPASPITSNVIEGSSTSSLSEQKLAQIQKQNKEDDKFTELMMKFNKQKQQMQQLRQEIQQSPQQKTEKPVEATAQNNQGNQRQVSLPKESNEAKQIVESKTSVNFNNAMEKQSQFSVTLQKIMEDINSLNNICKKEEVVENQLQKKIKDIQEQVLKNNEKLGEINKYYVDIKNNTESRSISPQNANKNSVQRTIKKSQSPKTVEDIYQSYQNTTGNILKQNNSSNLSTLKGTGQKLQPIKAVALPMNKSPEKEAYLNEKKQKYLQEYESYSSGKSKKGSQSRERERQATDQTYPNHNESAQQPNSSYVVQNSFSSQQLRQAKEYLHESAFQNQNAFSQNSLLNKLSPSSIRFSSPSNNLATKLTTQSPPTKDFNSGKIPQQPRQNNHMFSQTQEKYSSFFDQSNPSYDLQRIQTQDIAFQQQSNHSAFSSKPPLMKSTIKPQQTSQFNNLQQINPDTSSSFYNQNNFNETQMINGFNNNMQQKTEPSQNKFYSNQQYQQQNNAQQTNYNQQIQNGDRQRSFSSSLMATNQNNNFFNNNNNNPSFNTQQSAFNLNNYYNNQPSFKSFNQVSTTPNLWGQSTYNQVTKTEGSEQTLPRFNLQATDKSDSQNFQQKFQNFKQQQQQIQQQQMGQNNNTNSFSNNFNLNTNDFLQTNNKFMQNNQNYQQQQLPQQLQSSFSNRFFGSAGNKSNNMLQNQQQNYFPLSSEKIGTNYSQPQVKQFSLHQNPEQKLVTFFNEVQPFDEKVVDSYGNVFKPDQYSNQNISPLAQLKNQSANSNIFNNSNINYSNLMSANNREQQQQQQYPNSQDNVSYMMQKNNNVYTPNKDKTLLLRNSSYRESNFNYSINQYKKNFVSNHYTSNS